MAKYVLKLHVEKPGTPYFPPEGGETISRTGHAWYQVIDDGNPFSAGFGPANSKTQLSSVQGAISRVDESAYGGEPAYTMTYEITKRQLDILIEFSKNPGKFGFDQNSYNALTNSCVDFVVHALKAIGMNPGGYDGNLLPMDNIRHLRA